MNIRLDKRSSHGLQFGFNYTWSKAIDDARARNELGGNAGDNAFGNQCDRAADRGLSGNNIAHRFVSNATWALPSPSGKDLMRRAFGGWSSSLLFEARSGAQVWRD